MSVHLHLRKLDSYDDHPDWEPLIYANGGFKHFVRNVLRALPKVEERIGDPMDGEYVTRPTDFAAWRAAIAADPQIAGDMSCISRLVDILEKAPDYWLYVSQ